MCLDVPVSGQPKQSSPEEMVVVEGCGLCTLSFFGWIFILQLWIFPSIILLLPCLSLTLCQNLVITCPACKWHGLTYLGQVMMLLGSNKYSHIRRGEQLKTSEPHIHPLLIRQCDVAICALVKGWVTLYCFVADESERRASLTSMRKHSTYF